MSASVLATTYRWLARWQRPLKTLLALLAGLVFVTFLGAMVRAFHAEGYSLRTLLGQVEPTTLLGMVGLYAIALVATVWAWAQLVGTLATPLPWAMHWTIYTTTNITKRLPGSLWHVAGRALLYHQQGIPRRAVAVASGLEALLMLLSGTVVALGCWPALAHHLQGHWQLPLLLAVSGVTVATLFHKAGWQRVYSAGSQLDQPPALRRSQIVGWVLCYALAWLCGGAMVAWLATSFHPLPPLAWVGVAGSWTLSYLLGSVVALLPSGLGVAEISFTFLLSAYLPLPIAALVAIATRLLFTVLEGLFALSGWVAHRWRLG